MMKRAGHVVRMEAMRKAHRILVGCFEGKRPLEKSRRRKETNIKMDLKEIRCDLVSSGPE
jgi:hypothetical protein